MALHVYRRHRRDCKAGHPEDSLSSEFEERRKGWKRCDCPITVSGTLNKRYRRQSTGQWEWDAAKAIVAQWEQAGGWGAVPAASPMLADAPLASRLTVTEATEAFLDKIRSRALARATNHKYETFVRQVCSFANQKGICLIDQFTISDMDAFYAGWQDGKRARARKLDKLKTFVEFCLRRKWIAENIVVDLEPPEGHSVAANKTPFMDDELDRIFAACDKLGPPTPPGRGQRLWGGEDAKDFIYVMLYTGLRIGDVVSFDVSKRLNGNNIFLRMHKTRKELYSWIPDWLVNRILERSQRVGNLIFRVGKTDSLERQTQVWRIRVGKIFALAGEFSEPPVPHRLRHTFVRILLERGVAVGDVAELVGDTERTLLKHYGKWVTSRQARLSAILQDAFADRPKGNVVAIRG